MFFDDQLEVLDRHFTQLKLNDCIIHIAILFWEWKGNKTQVESNHWMKFVIDMKVQPMI
jgi:hypothetical protein